MSGKRENVLARATTSCIDKHMYLITVYFFMSLLVSFPKQPYTKTHNENQKKRAHGVVEKGGKGVN